RPVGALLTEFQSRHPGINIEVRVFRSEEQLHEELLAAISAHMPPHMAEISSSSGIAGLAATGELAAFDDQLSKDEKGAIDPGFTGTFEVGGQLWAMPYGAVVPLLYYNENLLGFSGISSGVKSLTWDEMVKMGLKMTRDVDDDGVTDIWGLVADQDSPWYLRSAVDSGGSGSADAAGHAFRLWHDLVYSYRLMPPLKHHMALSDFIDGTAGMLLAPSDSRTMLEQYIGGTFGFGVLPFPQIQGSSPTPAQVSGFVMLKSNPDTEHIVRQIVSYLLEPDIQKRLLNETAKIPVLRGTVAGLLKQKAGLSGREQAILGISEGNLIVDDYTALSQSRRDSLTAIQEELESTEEICFSCLSQAYMSGSVH
ncbi:extracellular solute-binding protein, partial [Paenibacillus sepulcri]|nr:extracellular solute-binding protein [Paenibacillus sepulcri]